MSSQTKSRWSTPLPQCSLPYFVFGPSKKRLSKAKIMIDAERPERAISLHEYRQLSRRVAVGLLRLGLQQTERVVCFSRNELCYPAVLMGTIMAGGILTPANPAYDAHELGHLMSYVEAKVLFTNRHLLPTALEAAEKAGLPKNRIFVFDDDIIDGNGYPEGEIQHFQTMAASDEDASNFRYKCLLSQRKYNHTIMIMFTSGTTGEPKGVQISHRNLIAMAMAFIHRLSLDPDWYANRHDRHALGSLHMSHLMAHRTCSVVFPKLRTPMYLLRRNDYLAVVEAVQKYRITDALVRASAVMEMAKHVDVCRRYDLRSLRSLEACAAPLSQEARFKLEGIGIKRVTRVWGLTETGTATGHHPLERDDSSSVGELHVNYEGRVTDPEDETRVLGRNEVGDIWLRGPSTSSGYWKNEDATRQLRGPDNWIRTGDIGYVDDNGKWYIVDRKKDLMKVNGNHVSPVELESALMQHPKIRDVGVIGVAVGLDEGPRAYVVPWEPGTLSTEEVANFLVGKVSPYKYLTGGVSFMEKIPRNATGKILRNELRNLAKKELGNAGNYHGIILNNASDVKHENEIPVSRTAIVV